jgi:signal peptidase I
MTAAWVAAAAVLALAVVAMVRRRFTTATVRGTSMTPTFADGARVLAVRRRDYRPGEVIVFRVGRTDGHDLAWRIKRIAAVPGDPVPAWLGDPRDVVPPDRVVVVGDNPRSQDSRQLGYIPRSRIAGRVVRVLRHAGRHR